LPPDPLHPPPAPRQGSLLGGAVKVENQGIRGSLAIDTKNTKLEFVVAEDRIGRQLHAVAAVF